LALLGKELINAKAVAARGPIADGGGVFSADVSFFFVF